MIQLKLDDFVFSDFEIPEEISFGGDQSLVIHNMVGGKRQIDAMGRNEVPKEWSGFFYGSDSVKRALYLDSLRVAGKQHSLTWDTFSYTVIVRSFHAIYKRSYIIPYKIVLEVVQDNIQPVVDPAPQDEWDFIYEVSNAVIIAQGFGFSDDQMQDAAALAELQAKTAAMQNYAQSINRKSLTIFDQLKELRNQINDIQNNIQTLIASTTNAITQITTLGGILPANTLSKNALTLGRTVATVNNSARLEELQFTLTRVNKNITAIDNTPNVRSITVCGGTLFKVALDEYGDATLWTVIAKANNLSDTNIAGIVTLLIPPKSSIQ